MTDWVEITDIFELQNLLDDFSPFRPLMNVYEREGPIYADAQQLEEWRAHPERHQTRDALRRGDVGE